MTTQTKDILIYNNEKLLIACEPLEDYLEKVQLPHKLVAPSSACWRGYYSKWAIDNKKLFLIEWRGFILDWQKVGIDYLFPDEEIVFAKWFSGEIRIPMGEIVNYVHGGYLSIYEGDMVLEFINGELVKEQIKCLTVKEVENIIVEKVKENKRDGPF